jgi:hypothetical protein
MGRIIYGKEPRVCYEGGNSAKGLKIYELHAACTCEKCEYRAKHLRRSIPNDATATTIDIDKIKEVKEFLNGWTCEDGSRELKTVYFKF